MNTASFKDGPAQGVALSLARTPILLRVVSDPGGSFDALDLLTDVCEDEEVPYLYVLTGTPSTAFVDGVRNGRRFGERRSLATYAYSEVQPGRDVMSDNAKWTAWCLDHRDAMTPEWAKGKTEMPE